MKAFATESIRNVGLAGHPGSGKTSLTEAMLFLGKSIDRLGKTEEGNTASDHDPEEIKRHISILTSVLPVVHSDVKLNLIDTPGTVDFLSEIRNGLRVADGLAIVVDATSGVSGGTEVAWEVAEEFGLPVCFVVNKMDKEHADFDKAVQSIRDTLGINAVPIVLPVGQEANFKGLVDMVEKTAIHYDDKGNGKKGDIPAEVADATAAAQKILVEAAAEGKDELIEKYFEENTLTDEETRQGLHAGFLQRRVFPVLCCSATTLVGVTRLKDFLANIFPAPNERPAVSAARGKEEIELKCDSSGPTAALVFKTVSDAFTGKITHFKVLSGRVADDAHLTNVGRSADERLGHLFAVIGKKHEPIPEVAAGDIAACGKLNATQTGDTLAAPKSEILIPPTVLPEPTMMLAIHADSKGDEEKIGIHIHKITDADPSLRIIRQPHLAQTVMAGMGDTHLDVALSRLKDAAKINISLQPPKVDYRETITKSASGSYRHKKQTGGAGQFGEVHLRLEPLTDGTDFEFEWEVVGGNIPTKYKSACEKGLREGLSSGFLAGCKAIGIRAAIYDGKDHPVDGKDIAFQIASLQAFKKVAKEAGAALLEPINVLDISVPEQYMGDIMGDLNSKRGRILGSEPRGKRIVIRAQVPQAETFTYARDLRSLTQGRGTYTSKFDHFERVPPEVQAKVVAAYTEERETAKA